jgi:hypothetical protein
VTAIVFLALCTVLAAPWLAGIAWAWAKRPRDGWIPPSAAEQALRRIAVR